MSRLTVLSSARLTSLATLVSPAHPLTPSNLRLPPSHPKQPPVATHSRKIDPTHRASRPPRKASSLFLMAQMRQLDDLDHVEHLFAGYLHVYEQNEGVLPANPRASFDQAVASCARRIRHERGLL